MTKKSNKLSRFLKRKETLSTLELWQQHLQALNRASTKPNDSVVINKDINNLEIDNLKINNLEINNLDKINNIKKKSSANKIQFSA